jgi:hypothetical protein
LFSDPLIQKTINDAFGNTEGYQERMDIAEGKEIAVMLENALWIKNDGKRDR